MDKKKYMPPNMRTTLKKTVHIDTTNETQFPSLSGRIVVTNKEWGVNKISNDDTQFQMDIHKALKYKWTPMNIINIEDEDEDEIDSVPLFSINLNNITHRIQFDKMLQRDVECVNNNMRGRFIDWFEALFHDIIIPDLTKNGYMFISNIVKIKSTILQWMYKIDIMSPTAIDVKFPNNPWIIPNKKLRREKDLEHFLEIFSNEYWNNIYNAWELDSHWMFNNYDRRGRVISEALPFFMYSLLDLQISSTTKDIDDEIASEEEAEAYSIVFSSRYRNNLDNANEFNDIIKRNDNINKEELRGDRKYDIW